MLDTKILDTQEFVLQDSLKSVSDKTTFFKSTNFLFCLTATLTVTVCLQLMLLLQGPVPLFVIAALGIIAISYFYSLRLSMIVLLVSCIGYFVLSNLGTANLSTVALTDSFIGGQIVLTLISVALAGYSRILKTGLRWEERLKYFAETHDDLTLLLNKNSFVQELDTLISTSPKNTERFALVLIDINGLEQINYDYGYKAGNAALHMISDRLRQAAQKGDLVARIDEDCFALVVRKMAHKAQLKGYIERVKAMLNLPFDYGWNAISLDTKLSSSFYPIDGNTAQELLDLNTIKLQQAA